MIGRTIAHYQITDRLGVGGMGEVYRARDTRLGRSVALKVLPDAFADDPERLQRFEREAKLLASLNHPNLATIHGIEHDEDRRVLVLELIEGEDLARRIARGAVPVDEALAIARQIADAVEAAHEQGVIHRDLKPANIVVTPDGVVKVLDFGLAKAIEGDPSSSSKLSQSPTLLGSSPTAAGVILGTAAYMSPEQARGRRVDRRADIFAFGCVFYEILTGQMAFSGETVSDTLAAVLRSEPDWSLLPAGTPRSVVRLLHRCLEKDPRQRLRDIGEARIVIDAAQRGESDPEAPAAATAPRRAARVAAVGDGRRPRRGGDRVDGAAARAVRSRQDELMQLSLLLPQGDALALRGEHPAPPAISPDGRHVVFGLSRQGGTVLCVRSLDNADPVVLTGTDGAGYPFWSPDSRQIGFFAQGKLKRVDRGGGPVTVVCDAALGKGGSWGPDGTIVFAPTYASAILRVAAEGGSPQAVTVADSTRGEVSHRFPRFLPDGRHFIYMTRSVATRMAQVGSAGVKLRVASLDGDLDRELMAAESNAVYADGYLLFARNDYLVAQRFDPATLELSGEPVTIASHLRMLPGASRAMFDASETGVIVYQAGAEVDGNQMTWVDLGGKVIGTLGEPAQHDDPIALSADGTQVAASIFDPRIGTPDVWIYDVRRNLRTRFTTDPGPDNNAVWSPDGSRIVFSSARRGHFDLFVKSLEGSKPEALLATGAGDNFAAAWSPDGRIDPVGTTRGGRRLATECQSGRRRKARARPRAAHGLWRRFFSRRRLDRL